MEVTLDKLLSGKSTRINSKDFLSTEDYVKPFIEEMSKFTSTYRIEAIPPSVTEVGIGKSSILLIPVKIS